MKKFLSLVIISVLVFVCISVYADAEIYTQIDSFSVLPGGTVTVPVYIKENTNISYLKLSVDSDSSVMSVTSADNGEVFTEQSFFAGNLDKMPHTSAWVNNNKYNKNGVLINLTLTVNEDVSKGIYPVKIIVNNGDALDSDGNVFEIPDFEFDLNVNGISVKKNKGSMSNIKKIRNYYDDFYDVIDEDWYYEDVKAAYEFGFTKNDEGAFNAFDKMTFNDTLELARKLSKAYYGENYDILPSFAELGMDFNDTITRAEFAWIMAHSLPSDAFEKINLFVTIPDVEESNPFYNEIYKLYAAGLFIGADENGCFYPESFIERSEAVAFINRLCNKENRVKIK